MNIREKIDSDYYKNKMEYPCDPRFDEKYRFLKGVMRISEISQEEFDKVSLLKKEYETALPEYYKNMDIYNKEEGRLLDEFCKDCEEEFGMKNHPKAGIVWSKAWEHGHANGLSNVLYWYEEFAEVAN